MAGVDRTKFVDLAKDVAALGRGAGTRRDGVAV